MANGKKPNNGSNPPKKKTNPLKKKTIASTDSTRYYAEQVINSQVRRDFHFSKKEREKATKKLEKDWENLRRQRYKGKRGYDKDGFPSCK